MNFLVNIFFLFITLTSAVGVSFDGHTCKAKNIENHSCCQKESKKNNQPCHAACCVQNMVDIRIKEVSSISSRTLLTVPSLNLPQRHFSVFHTLSVYKSNNYIGLQASNLIIKVTTYSPEFKQSWII
ncbi:hypothetical protein DNU06_11990 [Putridiphycobacter roseus]|uniref:Uncharacterized protein n=1 Tax=Putridiphycobacter roseus TaxID=2219161 RepID=A0A2W1NPM0_9FLAO|nr:hypothetical protein [Putridiphycobacter roseus]PZE16568.1 hypothetical protein DNU06_11990 [Putridiphycobacter roseus]